jgi:hypothetical protein
MFVDYKKCQMIPYLQGVNAGTIATFLACFDGHNEIFMFGFDGQLDQGKNNNIYAGSPCYDDQLTSVDDVGWLKSLYYIMKIYSHVKFYRVGGGKQYPPMNNLSNFTEVSYSSVAVVGDF